MKLTLSILLLLAVLQLFAQPDNPCSFPDTMEYRQLTEYQEMDNDYSEHHGEVYMSVESEDDLNFGEEEPVAQFDNVNIKIYAREISADNFDGLTFVMKNSGEWKVWDITLQSTNLDSILIYRPDAARFPHIIAIRYRSAFGSGMGSYDEINYQFWNVKELAFLGEFRAYYYTFGRDEDMESMVTTSSIFSSTRNVKFENGELSMDTTHVAKSVTKIKMLKNNSEKLDKALKNYKCYPVTYALKNGRFIRIKKE